MKHHPLHLLRAFARKPAGTRSVSPLLRVVLTVAIAVPVWLATSTGGYAETIHDAARRGDLARMQRLVVDGSDVNAKSTNDETPLIIASLEGQGEIVSYLLQRGADIDARNKSGMLALHAAAYGGHRDIVALLIVKGAPVNDAGNRFGVTPLHVAAEENHVDVVELLLQRGADPALVERNGYTPLTRAGWREHWQVAVVLLANGAICQEESKVGEWLYNECTKRTVN